MAIHPFGTKLYWDVGAGLVELGQLTRIGSPTDAFNFGDATHLNSPGKKREFIQGWGESGEVGFSLIYQGTVYAALRDQIGDFTTIVDFKIELPLEPGQVVGGASILFSGFFTQVMIAEYDRDQDDAVEIECTVKVTGDLTFEEGS